MSDLDTDNKEESSGFLNRWSRRKNQQLEEVDIKEQALAEKTDDKDIPEQNLKTDEDMPAVESLTEESDYSGFLSPKVSEVLRRQALRKLFHMPSLNVVDGLDDYAEDFTNFIPLGDLVTEEMKRVFAREKAKEEAEAEAESAAAAEEADQESVKSIDDAEPDLDEAATGESDQKQENLRDEAVIDETEQHDNLMTEELPKQKDNAEHE